MTSRKIIATRKKDGNRHFAEQGSVAEITTDLVSQAWAKMSEHKVNRPADSIVSEMIKQLPQVYGAGRRLQFVEDREACVPEKTRCSTKERDNALQSNCMDDGDVAVVCDLSHSPLGVRKKSEGWKQQMAIQILWNVGTERKRKIWDSTLQHATRKHSNLQFYVDEQLVDFVSLEDAPGADDEGLDR